MTEPPGVRSGDGVHQPVGSERFVPTCSLEFHAPLPRAAWGRSYFPNAHSLNSVLEVLPINSISITNQIARRLIFRKGFDDLLRRPSRRRMFGDIEVNHSASFLGQNNEHK